MDTDANQIEFLNIYYRSTFYYLNSPVTRDMLTTQFIEGVFFIPTESLLMIESKYIFAI